MTLRERARALAKGHYCEEHCGLVEDIEHEMEVVQALALEKAAAKADYYGMHMVAADIRALAESGKEK